MTFKIQKYPQFKPETTARCCIGGVSKRPWASALNRRQFWIVGRKSGNKVREDSAVYHASGWYAGMPVRMEDGGVGMPLSVAHMARYSMDTHAGPSRARHWSNLGTGLLGSGLAFSAFVVPRANPIRSFGSGVSPVCTRCFLEFTSQVFGENESTRLHAGLGSRDDERSPRVSSSLGHRFGGNDNVIDPHVAGELWFVLAGWFSWFWVLRCHPCGDSWLI